MSRWPLPQLTLPMPTYSAEDPGGWDHMTGLARAADNAGIDRVIMSDHVVFGERLEEYAKPENGGAAGGKQPTGPDGHWLDPFTTMTFLAGMTKRIRFRSQIILLALRRPVTMAKQAATLDVLSGGRLELGVGVGWQREEYEAAGLSFEGRGRLLDHSMEVCRTLWTEQRASYSSPELSFENIHQMPKPLQPGGVPLWISGTLRGSTLRRIAEFGAGWIPWGPEGADLVNSVPRMKEGVAKAGGNPDNLQVAGVVRALKDDNGEVNLERTFDALLPEIKAGVTDFVSYIPLPKELDAAEARLAEIVKVFRQRVGRSDA